MVIRETHGPIVGAGVGKRGGEGACAAPGGVGGNSVIFSTMFSPRDPRAAQAPSPPHRTTPAPTATAAPPITLVLPNPDLPLPLM